MDDTTKYSINTFLLNTSEALTEQFKAVVSKTRDEVSCQIKVEQILEVCTYLRDEYNYKMLAALTAVDYFPAQEPRFHLVYQLHNLDERVYIELRVHVPGTNPSIKTIESIFPNANWHEREIYDMFGVHFEDHSNLRRVIMPHDWVGHPLRKDYPLGYEEVQFTFNEEEIRVTKPFIEE